jgi:hypothetical protein
MEGVAPQDGRILEKCRQLTGQKNSTRRVLRRVTSIWLFAASVRLRTQQVFAPVELEAPKSRHRDLR